MIESGLLNLDGFSQVLRGYSQRRRQGIMELQIPEGMLQVYFLQGRIIDARLVNVNPAAEVVEVLQAGGLLAAGFHSQAKTYADLFKEIEADAESAANIDQELFQHVVKHRVLDRVYALDLQTGVYYAFKAQMVDIERGHTPSISVGQLLLDFVSLPENEAKFREIFPESQRIAPVGPEDPSLSENEETVFLALAEGPLLPTELLKRSLLSKAHFYEAALSLIERNKLRAAIDGEESIAGSVGDLESILAAEPMALAAAEKEVVAVLPESELAQGEAAELQVSLGVLNARLLYKSWAPMLTLLVFLACLVIGPLVFWQPLLDAVAGW